jgi:hypothetical protein
MKKFIAVFRNWNNSNYQGEASSYGDVLLCRIVSSENWTEAVMEAHRIKFQLDVEYGERFRLIILTPEG